MNVTCNDLDRILEHRDSVELAALEAHAAGCDACREQLALEREISAAARQMQRSWECPDLWPRIRERLAVQPKPAGARWNRWLIFEGWGLHWQMAAATAALALLAIVSTWLVLGYRPPEPGPAPNEVVDTQQRLLTEEALAEVERSEAAYIASIERLSKLAAPRLQAADSPLLVNYREKLLVLDSAIAECRAQLEQNRFNAHLRRELLSIYQMKQAALTDVLQEVSQ